MSVRFNSIPKALPTAALPPQQNRPETVHFSGQHDEERQGGIHPFQSLFVALRSVLHPAPLPVPTQLRTRVEHEPQDEFVFDVPHHFQVIDNETDNVVAEVNFQRGPVKENGLNGVQNEELLEMVAARLRGFQASPFASPETSEALKHVEAALAQLNARTARREARGVEGSSRK